jgi:hypothetical protein
MIVSHEKLEEAGTVSVSSDSESEPAAAHVALQALASRVARGIS